MYAKNPKLATTQPTIPSRYPVPKTKVRKRETPIDV